jgi:hypothetical protein
VARWPGRTNETVLQLAADTERIYVAHGATGLTILDATKPGELLEAGRFNPPDGVRAVEISGSNVYVMNDSAVMALDVSDPAQLRVTSRFPIQSHPGWGSRFTVHDQRVFAADAEKGLLVLDFTNPSQPTLAETVTLTNKPINSIVVSGTTAFVTDGDLHIIDLSNPRGSHRTLEFGIHPAVRMVVVDGNGYGYFSRVFFGGSEDLYALELGNPDAGTRVGIAGRFGDIAVSGHKLFVAESSRAFSALRVFDVAVPLAPVEIGQWTTPGSTFAVVGNRVCVGSWDGSVELIEFTPQIQMSATINGGALQVSWASDPGARYQLQSASNLTSGVWTDVGAPITATELVTRAPTFPLTSGRRFFRLQARGEP